MLLAGGTVTFVAPWLLQTNRAVAVEPLLAGACFLVLHIAVGAAIDLIDPWLLRNMAAAIGKSATASRARASAEDHRLVAAQAGVFHAQLLRSEETMVRADGSAGVDVTSARARLDWWQTLLDAMLHALFIAGVLCVGWAVVAGMLAHSQIRSLPIPAPPSR
jgi:ABC-type transport system involved in cytochrome bd biosynthesis fused ATPase/permease subunit